MTTARVLVAGIGNVLRGDDGFGPAVVQALERAGLPAGVETREYGIGGIGIVRELMDGYDALILVDATDRGEPPGTLSVQEVVVPPAESLAEPHRLAVADPHQTVPSRALLLARALDVLPAHVWIVGCQPAETEELSLALGHQVSAAVPRAVQMIRRLMSPRMERPGDRVGPEGPRRGFE